MCQFFTTVKYGSSNNFSYLSESVWFQLTTDEKCARSKHSLRKVDDSSSDRHIFAMSCSVTYPFNASSKERCELEPDGDSPHKHFSFRATTGPNTTYIIARTYAALFTNAYSCLAMGTLSGRERIQAYVF